MWKVNINHRRQHLSFFFFHLIWKWTFVMIVVQMFYLAKPLKNFPMAMKSSWSEQLNTTHWMAIALAKSCQEKVMTLKIITMFSFHSLFFHSYDQTYIPSWISMQAEEISTQWRIFWSGTKLAESQTKTIIPEGKISSSFLTHVTFFFLSHNISNNKNSMLSYKTDFDQPLKWRAIWYHNQRWHQGVAKSILFSHGCLSQENTIWHPYGPWSPPWPTFVVSVLPVPAGPAGAPPNFKWRAPVKVR